MGAVALGLQDALKVVLDRYMPMVSRTSYRILCDRDDSEDVTQEVFIRVWKNASGGRSSDKQTQAQRVFDILRAFDSVEVSQIYAQCPDTDGVGLAVVNRLKRAAGFACVNV